MNCSVIVPVYDSEQTLTLLIERLQAVLLRATDAYEAILVDDASSDASWQTIQGLSAAYPWVRGVQLARNYGQHNALLCGIREARYDVIVTMDDDLQNPPEEIPSLLHKLSEGYDVVYGTPRRQQHGLFRNIASRLTKIALQGAMGADTARNVSAFRAFHSSVREGFAAYQNPHVSIDVLLTWGARRFGAVTVRHDPRAAGESHYTVSKLLTHALNMMTGFSTAPLRAASLLGFAFSLFGVVLLIYVVTRYLIEGTPIPGFPFLASAIVIFSGVQLFALGIIGEYIARMHFRTMDRPSYVVRQLCGVEEKVAR